MEYIEYECDGDGRLLLVARLYQGEDAWEEDLFRGGALEGVSSLSPDDIGGLYATDVGEGWFVGSDADLDEELATAGTEVATGVLAPGRHWFRTGAE